MAVFFQIAAARQVRSPGFDERKRLHHASRRMTQRLIVFAVLVLAWMATPRSSCAASAPLLDPSLSPMRGLIEGYLTDEQALKRRETVSASTQRYQRLKRFYSEHLQALGDQAFDNLDQDGKVDYVLYKSRLKFELQELEREKKQTDEMAELIPFASKLIALEENRRAMETLDAAHAAETVAAIAEEIARVRKKVSQQVKDGASPSNTPPGKVVGNRAARTLDDLRSSLKEWRAFYAGYDPEFTWWLRQPYEKCDKELQDYAQSLRKEVVGVREGEDDPLVGDPIGRAALLDALASEFIPYTPEELIDIANKEFAWCEKEWRRASADLGFGDDWRKALNQVASLHVKPGDQPQLIRELAQESVKFLEDRNLVTLPELCQEVWRMEMMTPDRQKVSPYFTGGEVISISFPTDTMSHEDKIMSLRGNNKHFCRATVHHELIPGHHLQAFMSARYRTHRRGFQTPFLVEGWALYWEMLLWDLNFPKSAEDRVGMLFWRTHRCARIIFSLKFHLGEMNAQEAIDFLVDRVGHERRNATAEVRRSIGGGYGPLYQAAYMLGGLQIRAMRHELVDSKKMTDRVFHDAILRENAISIEMIRASLEGLPLTQDYTPRWRFYEPAP